MCYCQRKPKEQKKRGRPGNEAIYMYVLGTVCVASVLNTHTLINNYFSHFLCLLSLSLLLLVLFCRRTCDRVYCDLKHQVLLASFPGLPRFFCSSVSVDNNTRMREGGEKRGRPGKIHHVSDVRWTQGWT